MVQIIIEDGSLVHIILHSKNLLLEVYVCILISLIKESLLMNPNKISIVYALGIEKFYYNLNVQLVSWTHKRLLEMKGHRVTPEDVFIHSINVHVMHLPVGKVNEMEIPIVNNITNLYFIGKKHILKVVISNYKIRREEAI